MLNGGFGKNQFILYYLHLSFKKEKYLQEAWENLVIYLEVCHWDPQLLSQLLDSGPSTFTVIALPYSKVGKVMYGAPSPQGTPQGTDSIKTTNVLQIKSCHMPLPSENLKKNWVWSQSTWLSIPERYLSVNEIIHFVGISGFYDLLSPQCWRLPVG